MVSAPGSDAAPSSSKATVTRAVHRITVSAVSQVSTMPPRLLRGWAASSRVLCGVITLQRCCRDPDWFFFRSEVRLREMTGCADVDAVCTLFLAIAQPFTMHATPSSKMLGGSSQKRVACVQRCLSAPPPTPIPPTAAATHIHSCCPARHSLTPCFFRPSLKASSTSCVLAAVALNPRRPTRQIWPAVGPSPPASSRE